MNLRGPAIAALVLACGCLCPLPVPQPETVCTRPCCANPPADAVPVESPAPVPSPEDLLVAAYSEPRTGAPLLGFPLVLENARMGPGLKGKLFIEHAEWDKPEVEVIVSPDGARSFILSLRGFRMGGRLLGRVGVGDLAVPYNLTVATTSDRFLGHLRCVPEVVPEAPPPTGPRWRVEPEGTHAYIEGLGIAVEDYPAWASATRATKEAIKARIEDAIRRKLIASTQAVLERMDKP